MFRHYPRCHAWPRLAAGIFALLLAASSPAQEDDARESQEYRDSTGFNPFAIGGDWRESDARLPAFPRRDDLVPFEPSDPSVGFRYYLDSAHLNVGADDVTRYTVVIQSSSGAVNVRHEGLRCETREVKPYGYGTADGKMKLMKSSRWRRVSGRGATSYQRALLINYFCDDSQYPYPAKEINARLRDIARADTDDASNRGQQGDD